MNKLSSADRSALIRLASSLPTGSPAKRAILAGLSKTKRAAHDDSGFTERRTLLGQVLKGGPGTPKVFHSARLRTRDEVSDKANAALALIQGIDISGDDARIIKKVEILLEDIVELQEGNSWF